MVRQKNSENGGWNLKKGNDMYEVVILLVVVLVLFVSGYMSLSREEAKRKKNWVQDQGGKK